MEDPLPACQRRIPHQRAADATGVAVFIVWPPPPMDGTVEEWFALFQDNPLLGLLSMDLLLMVIYVLLVPIFLGLFAALRHYSASWMAPGKGLGLLGISAFLASNIAVQMLDLSKSICCGGWQAERAEVLGAGRAMLATYQGTAFHASYIMGSIAGIIVSAVMLKSRAFGRTPGYAGVVGNFLGFGLYIQ